MARSAVRPRQSQPPADPHDQQPARAGPGGGSPTRPPGRRCLSAGGRIPEGQSPAGADPLDLGAGHEPAALAGDRHRVVAVGRDLAGSGSGAVRRVPVADLPPGLGARLAGDSRRGGQPAVRGDPGRRPRAGPATNPQSRAPHGLPAGAGAVDQVHECAAVGAGAADLAGDSTLAVALDAGGTRCAPRSGDCCDREPGRRPAAAPGPGPLGVEFWSRGGLGAAHLERGLFVPGDRHSAGRLSAAQRGAEVAAGPVAHPRPPPPACPARLCRRVRSTTLDHGRLTPGLPQWRVEPGRLSPLLPLVCRVQVAPCDPGAGAGRTGGRGLARLAKRLAPGGRAGCPQRRDLGLGQRLGHAVGLSLCLALPPAAVPGRRAPRRLAVATSPGSGPVGRGAVPAGPVAGPAASPRSPGVLQ